MQARSLLRSAEIDAGRRGCCTLLLHAGRLYVLRGLKERCFGAC
jgi:hypothetical protein